MKECTFKLSHTASRCFPVAFALLLLLCIVATSKAQTVTVYNSIPNPLPPNVASEGPEAYAFSELGDGLNLAGPEGRTLDRVTVVLSSWGCQNGNWYTKGTCVTTAGATFAQPITVNVFSVVPGPTPAVGSLLATTTQTFEIPYRPSSNSVNCDGTAWYDRKTETCYHGITVPITVDLSSLHVTLPSQIIVGVAFNTTHYGPVPIGEAAPCYSTGAGCPYDSLNISTDSNGGFYQAIGSVLDVDGIFVNYTSPANSCSGTAVTGIFALDASPGCWTGYHPEIQISAHKNQNEKGYHHGNQHNGRGNIYW